MTSNWIEECASEAGLECWLPLWQQQRDELLEEMLQLGFELVFTCVKAPWFGEETLGRKLDAAMLDQLRSLSSSHGLDVSGEKGEYHTMCLDSPIYLRRISLIGVKGRELAGRPGQGSEKWWVLDAKASLEDKPPR